MKAMIAVILIAVSLTGCAYKFTEVKDAKVNQAFMVNSSPTFRGYDYIGSDASHHYFIGKWDYATDQRFKVKISEMVVNSPMPVGKAQVEVLLWKPTASEYEEFGKIGDRTLFKKK